MSSLIKRAWDWLDDNMIIDYISKFAVIAVIALVGICAVFMLLWFVLQIVYVIKHFGMNF